MPGMLLLYRCASRSFMRATRLSDASVKHNTSRSGWGQAASGTHSAQIGLQQGSINISWL